MTEQPLRRIVRDPKRSLIVVLTLRKIMKQKEREKYDLISSNSTGTKSPLSQDCDAISQSEHHTCQPDLAQSPHLRNRLNFLIFMTMGCGTSWVFANALAQEIPFFQRTLPQGLCIATYMNATTNIGLFLVVTYLWIHNYVRPVPHNVLVPSVLVLGTMGAFLSAFASSVTVMNVPVVLYCCCAIGGTVGALSAVAVSPFLMLFERDYISAARTGGSAGSLLTALVGLIQNPGSQSERMSTRTYFIIFGLFLALPIGAYVHVVRRRIGFVDNEDCFRVPDNDAPQEIESGELELVPANRFEGSPLDYHHRNGVEGQDRDQHRETGSQSAPSASGSSSGSGPDSSSGVEPEADCIVGFVTAAFDATAKRLCADQRSASMPWLRQTLPYMFMVGWVDFNTWGMLSALTPFAMANVSANGGAENLATAFQLGTVCLVLGDLSTTQFKLPFARCLLAFTVLAFIVYMCAAGVIRSPGGSAAPVVIVVFATGRLLEAHLLTSAYREIAGAVAVEHREAAARAMGCTDQVMTTLGTILSTVLVSRYATC